MTKLNCIGDICPVPVIKTKKALAEPTVLSLEVVVDNDIAVQNISKMLNAQGLSYSQAAVAGGHFSIRIHKNGTQAMPDTIVKNQDHTQLPEPSKTGTTVVVSSQFMGSGDDVLGAILIKGFFFALTQLETLPNAIIFYNGGVHHALKNAPALQDLQQLQQENVKILVCGTCLNHYNVLADLAVGEVSNMYEIATCLAESGNIVRP